jgi:GDPmannose 4,6-dehydratase
MPRALITGVTGQDGSYLAEFLLGRGYEVHGTVRRSSSLNTARIDHLYHDQHEAGAPFYLHYADLTDALSIGRVLEVVAPDEVYNLGAQSHVRVSFDLADYTADTVGMGTLRLLEAIRLSRRDVRFYQAGSSEMFGNVPAPQDETTPFRPASPYAAAKVFAYHLAVQYRDAYGMFATNGILFNHESPRRGETFVTRKITRAVAAIVAGKQDKLYLGNLTARRDWGYAPEYVETMWRMLQEDEPGDFVVATGESHSVQEFAELAFGLVSLDWRSYVEVDSRYFRPNEVECLLGDASRARERLGWRPATRFPALVQIMLEADLRAAGVDPAEKLAVPPILEQPA